MWMRRVQEFSTDPRLFRDGTDRFDINQGQAGTCWFLAVLASLAEFPLIIEQVSQPDSLRSLFRTSIGLS